MIMLGVLGGCSQPVDALVGSYSFMVTGTDTENAPTSSSSTVSGTGTIAVTHAYDVGKYAITIAEVSSTACTLVGTANENDPTIMDIPTGQTCTLQLTDGEVIATITTGGVKLIVDSMLLNLRYSFSGSTYGSNTAGVGIRTYGASRF
jgi:hypothetical protein